VFAVAGQRRFAPWLIASAFVHAFGAAGFALLRPPPAEPLAPLRVVRVDLVAASAPLARGPAATAAPVTAHPLPAEPQPRARPEPRPAPRPAAKPTPAPASAPEPASDLRAANAGAGARALAAVGAGPPGAGAEAAGAGAPSADALAAYIARLQRAIDAHKSYPPMARRRGIEGVVTVRLAIDALGGLEAAALVGRPPDVLARSTRDAVAKAGPFPPPPGGRLQVEFPVRYEIVD
jgi:periplasmic protein TonB